MSEIKTTYDRSWIQILSDSVHNLLPGVPDEKGSTDPKFCTIPSNSPNKKQQEDFHSRSKEPAHSLRSTGRTAYIEITGKSQAVASSCFFAFVQGHLQR